MTVAQYPFLIVPLMLMLFENERTIFFLYLLLCVGLAGLDGLVVGSLYWFMMGLVRVGMAILDARGLLEIRKGADRV